MEWSRARESRCMPCFAARSIRTGRSYPSMLYPEITSGSNSSMSFTNRSMISFSLPVRMRVLISPASRYATPMQKMWPSRIEFSMSKLRIRRAGRNGSHGSNRSATRNRSVQ